MVPKLRVKWVGGRRTNVRLSEALMKPEEDCKLWMSIVLQLVKEKLI